MTFPTIESLAAFIAADILRQPGRKISPEEPLLSSGLIDSFHLMDLALFVEEHFGVRIEDADLSASTFDNLTQLVAYIETHR